MNNSRQELLDLLEEIYSQAEEEYITVLENYKNSMDKVNLLIAGLFISHASSGILDYRSLLTKGILNKLKYDIKNEIQENVESEISNLRNVLHDVFKKAYLNLSNSLMENTELEVNIDTLTDEYVDKHVDFDWSGIHYSERITNNQSALFNTIWTSIIIGIQNSESIDEIADNVSKSFNSKAKHSLSLMTTEAARLISDAIDNIYNNNPFKRVEYISALEVNTCGECATLHGSVYDIDDPSRPMLPRHNRCKCIYLPVI